MLVSQMMIKEITMLKNAELNEMIFSIAGKLEFYREPSRMLKFFTEYTDINFPPSTPFEYYPNSFSYFCRT